MDGKLHANHKCWPAEVSVDAVAGEDREREANLQEELLLQAPMASSYEEGEVPTGLPTSLKSAIEDLSGLSMDDVAIHYNSSKPAELQALAYTQGSEIYLGPGQERHLAHEAWHVVQQKQGRVKPTLQTRGVAINDDQELEKEAHIMGWKASQSATIRWQQQENHASSSVPGPIDSRILSSQTMPIQCYFTHEEKKISSGDLDTIQAAILGILPDDEEGEDIANEFYVTRAEGTPTDLIDWLNENDLPLTVASVLGPLPAASPSKKNKGKSPIKEVKVKKQQKSGEKPLNEIAQEIHREAKGHASSNTTGVGRLKSGQLVVATQVKLEAMGTAAQKLYQIGDQYVMATLGSGYHAEVTLYIVYGDELVWVGASQGFCPACHDFLTHKKIGMDGERRSTSEQVWRSPEYYYKVEKEKGAPYPWLYELIEPDKVRMVFKTMAEYKDWYKARTGDDWPPEE
jgi:hypothetical protein